MVELMLLMFTQMMKKQSSLVLAEGMRELYILINNDGEANVVGRLCKWQAKKGTGILSTAAMQTWTTQT